MIFKFERNPVSTIHLGAAKTHAIKSGTDIVRSNCKYILELETGNYIVSATVAPASVNDVGSRKIPIFK